MLTANEILEWDDGGTPVVAPPPLLDVEGLSKAFAPPRGWRPWRRAEGARTIQALDHVSLAVHRNESLGIVGGAGSGKSTLARIVMGHMAPEDGFAARTAELAMMTQDGAAFFPARQTLGMIVTVAIAAREIIQPTDLTDSRRLAARLLERVGLAPDLFADQTMSRLSKGQRRRLAVALAMVGEPQLVILDEPTAGLDAVSAAPLIALLQELRSARGLTYLVLSRDIQVVQSLSSRMATLDKGRLSGPGQL
jgi:peptide/nickel transport system ATP-binding protein